MKAQELIEKHKNIIELADRCNYLLESDKITLAKEGALIDIQNTIDATRITAFAAGKNKAWIDKQSQHLQSVQKELLKNRFW